MQESRARWGAGEGSAFAFCRWVPHPSLAKGAVLPLMQRRLALGGAGRVEGLALTYPEFRGSLEGSEERVDFKGAVFTPNRVDPYPAPSFRTQ